MSHPNWIDIIKKSLKQSKSRGVNFIQLATVSQSFPKVRTVVFRGFFNKEQTDILTFTTHYSSEKVDEIKINPKVQLCWWFEDTNQQFRISGTAHLITSPKHNLSLPTNLNFSDFESERQSHFNGLSSTMQASFLWPKPGAIRKDEDKAFPYVLKEEEKEEALNNFVLVLVEPNQVDFVSLEKYNHVRVNYIKGEEANWEYNELNP